MKKLFSLLLAAVFTVGCVPTVTAADSNPKPTFHVDAQYGDWLIDFSRYDDAEEWELGTIITLDYVGKAKDISLPPRETVYWLVGEPIPSPDEWDDEWDDYGKNGPLDEIYGNPEAEFFLRNISKTVQTIRIGTQQVEVARDSNIPNHPALKAFVVDEGNAYNFSHQGVLYLTTGGGPYQMCWGEIGWMMECYPPQKKSKSYTVPSPKGSLIDGGADTVDVSISNKYLTQLNLPKTTCYVSLNLPKCKVVTFPGQKETIAKRAAAAKITKKVGVRFAFKQKGIKFRGGRRGLTDTCLKRK